MVRVRYLSKWVKGKSPQIKITYFRKYAVLEYDTINVIEVPPDLARRIAELFIGVIEKVPWVTIGEIRYFKNCMVKDGYIPMTIKRYSIGIGKTVGFVFGLKSDIERAGKELIQIFRDYGLDVEVNS